MHPEEAGVPDALLPVAFATKAPVSYERFRSDSRWGEHVALVVSGPRGEYIAHMANDGLYGLHSLTMDRRIGTTINPRVMGLMLDAFAKHG